MKKKATHLTLKEVQSQRKKTVGLRVSNYAEERDYIIGEIKNLTQAIYPNDKEVQSAVINLTVALKVAEPDAFFVQDLHGFLIWSRMTSQKPSSILTTCLHDLSEFTRNRNEKWFCPRTTGYRKHLTERTTI